MTKKKENTLTRITDSHTFKLDKDEANVVDGALEVPVIVAREMVYDYGDTKAYKPKEELEKAAQFADGIAITRSHPEAGIVTDQAEILGTFKNPKMVDEEFGGVLRITNKSLIADVQDGTLKEVSGGFFCNLDRTASGEYEGTHYDATQTNIVLNHIAVVDQGRCSLEDGCGIQKDSTPKQEPKPEQKPEQKAKIDKATEDSELNTKLSETVLALKTDNEKLRADLDAITMKEREAIISELIVVQDTKGKEDLLKLTVPELRKELNMVNQIQATRLSVDRRDGGTKAIDKAYEEIGRKK